MSIKEILQGKWLGHPLHAAMVHLPTGLWPAALFFDILARAGREPVAMARTAFWCILLGLLVVPLAVPTGIADWMEVKREKPAWKMALVHLILNVTVAGLWLVNLLLRVGHGYGHVSNIDLVLSIVATALLGVSGYLGGRMVYDHGIGVARVSKKAWRQRAVEGQARVPKEKE